MRNQLKRTISAALAIGLLGYAVMLSVGMAESPYRRTRGENAFERPIGHPEKALIAVPWLQHSASEAWLAAEPAPSMPAAPMPTAETVAFDWGIESHATCPKCALKDSKVTPVVFDVPDALGPSDATAIETIKRKLGINSFRGTIFDGAEPPARQLIKQDAPAKLLTLDRVLEGVDRCDESCSCPSSACATDQTKSTSENSAKTDDDCPGATPPAGNRPRAVSLEPVRDEAIDYDPISVLRQTGWELDHCAQNLEDIDRFTEADALRDAAQVLRVKARELRHAKTATALREAPRWARPVTVGGYDSSAVQSGYGWEVHEE
jgi:hypothetical protein